MVFNLMDINFNLLKDADKTKADTITFELTSLSPKTIIFKLIDFNPNYTEHIYLFVALFLDHLRCKPH